MPSRTTLKIVESISVREFYESFKDELKMHLVYGSEGLDKRILEKSINRPALVLTGYLKHFAFKRIQLFGAGEMSYLRDLSEAKQTQSLETIAEKKIPCIVLSRNLAPTKTLISIAQKFKIPLIRTPLTTKIFITEATVLLEEKFALQTTMHGTLMDIEGIGTLLRGDSGVGKSECALALIERGHSLVADDLVYIKQLRDKELTGTGPEFNRGYMECRGIGIINIAELFGIRSVRLDKRIDLIITFSVWEPGMHEERTGLEKSSYEILGIQVPHMKIPVRPGRDMARLAEVAAMVQALKMIGHDSAKEFNERLIDHINNKKQADK